MFEKVHAYGLRKFILFIFCELQEACLQSPSTTVEGRRTAYHKQAKEVTSLNDTTGCLIMQRNDLPPFTVCKNELATFRFKVAYS